MGRRYRCGHCRGLARLGEKDYWVIPAGLLSRDFAIHLVVTETLEHLDWGAFIFDSHVYQFCSGLLPRTL